ncbi:T9SS type A sorting domain-containing protein [Flavobacterium sp. LMO8]|uniref:T9SS type A sorting domain-containing protein n=1 Tax=Flavobacterium sp. LMO8 TaxID=2654244 RepID=UPI001292633F|nr:T9SS type A sorting domain-containing protein [Flavobacterium sp. LMO8]MQP25456.1 T9SS type A sorting domain-containing protein [Flavobacterium sp. LMO8]
MNKKNYLLLVVLHFYYVTSFGQVVYSNGGLSTGNIASDGTVAPTGYNWSQCQANAGSTTEANGSIGYNGGFSTDNSINVRLIDDFIVPSGQTWTITDFDFYCYQPNYTGTTPPIDGFRIQIWNGDPQLTTSSVVLGDLTTNIYDAANSGEAFLYRASHPTIPNTINPITTTRKIWRVRANLSASLPAGTYWIVFQAHALNNSNVLFPPVTISEIRGLPGWNAKQYNAVTNLWFNLFDDGLPLTATNVNQDIPFDILNIIPLSNEDFDLPQIKLFPNPVGDYFQVANGNDVDRIEIYSIHGQKVKIFTRQDTYSIADLAKGVYVAKLIKKDNSEITNVKIVKQ